MNWPGIVEWLRRKTRRNPATQINNPYMSKTHEAESLDEIQNAAKKGKAKLRNQMTPEKQAEIRKEALKNDKK